MTHEERETLQEITMHRKALGVGCDVVTIDHVLWLLDAADALDAAEARAAQAERQVRVLAAKLSETCGAGPCDSEVGGWPCPLVKLADGSDCTNDEGGCCWAAWSSAQAAQE